MESNPLLAGDGPPRFSAIRAEHVEPAVRQRIDESRATLERYLAGPQPPTWESLVAPLDEADERLENAWRPADHLGRVLHDEAMRAADKRVQPLVAEHATSRSQDERLWRALTAIRADDASLSPTRKKILDDQLREFRLAGVHLPAAGRDRVREIQVELARLSVEFAEHVTDSADAFRLVVDSADDVAGLPEALVAAARAQALKDDASAPRERWSFTLQAPSMIPFLTYQKNRALRERTYRANVTRATSGTHDNGPILRRTLELRADLAQVLGFRNYAEMALVRRMAKSPEEVHAFLLDLAARARPRALADREELTKLARERDGIGVLERWDTLYFREILRRERCAFSDEEVRSYFPLERVLAGLFEVIRRLYGVTVADRTGIFETWHPDVRVLEFRDGDRLLGHVMVDLFARTGKHSGAWVSSGTARKILADGSVRTPIAYLVCNFPAPGDGKPSCLRHSEIETLFHECGHALHQVFSTTAERQCAGSRGVPRDGVELPSQFFENWTWHEEPLAFLSAHVATGEPLPAELRAKMLAAKNFMKGIDIVRQMELATADLELHMSTGPFDEQGVHAVFDSVRRRVSVLPTPEYDRFENGFAHIFSGGYAAGYYGYAWADVLAADAISRFDDEGLWSHAASRDFRDQVLARGGSADFMDLYVAFRGRRPTADALLRSCGLA